MSLSPWLRVASNLYNTGLPQPAGPWPYRDVTPNDLPSTTPVDLTDPNPIGSSAPWSVNPATKPSELNPFYSNVDVAGLARSGARDRYRSIISRPLPQAPDAVRPALRTQDLIYGAAPALLLSLFGKGQAAGDYLGNYLQGKTARAQMDTASRQLGYQNQLAGMNREEDLAKANLGFANEDYAAAAQELSQRIAMQKANQADAENRARYNMTLAQKFHDDAMNPNSEPSFRVTNANQALAILRSIPDDPAAQQMVANLTAALPNLERMSTANMTADARLKKAQFAVNHMEDDLQQKYRNTEAQISARMAYVSMAAATSDRAWFDTMLRLYDSQIELIDKQLDRWAKYAQDNPAGLPPTFVDDVIRPLADQKNSIIAQKDALPLPGRAADYAPRQPGATVPLPGQLPAPEGGVSGPIGPRVGSGIPGAMDGYNSRAVPIKTTTDVARANKAKHDQKAADRTDSDWEAARKKVVELRAKVASADPTDTVAKEAAQRELNVWTQRMETLKPGSTGKPRKAGLGRTVTDVVTEGVSGVMARTLASKYAKDIKFAREAIEAGRDKAAVKAKFKKDTGLDYDQVVGKTNAR